MVRTIIKQLAIIGWSLGLLIHAQGLLSQPDAQPTTQLLVQKVLLIGHDCGWCTLYGETLSATDARIGRLLEVISDREQNRSEQWLVMLVADHGHRKGGGHGGDSVVERTSFIGVNKPALMNNLFFEPGPALELSDDEASNGLMGYPGVTSVVPTIMEYLGYPARSEDGFSAPALIGSSGGL